MPREKEFTWNGITYASQKLAAEAIGVTPSVIGYYIRNGYTCDDDLVFSTKSNPTTWNGIEYNSLTEAANANEITTQLMWNRLQAGFTCDAEVDHARQYRKKPDPVTWNGIDYQSTEEAADNNGVSYGTMYQWLHKGYTCDDDIERKNRIGPYFWNGIEYSTLRAAGLAQNPPITREAMRLRINKGYTCDDDLKYKKGDN